MEKRGQMAKIVFKHKWHNIFQLKKKTIKKTHLYWQKHNILVPSQYKYVSKLFYFIFALANYVCLMEH